MKMKRERIRRIKNMGEIENKSIAIILVTSYPKWYEGKLKNIRDTDKIRGDLALELVYKAKDLGFQVVVSDSGSSKTFRQNLFNIKSIKIIKRKSSALSLSRREAIRKASKIKNIKAIVSTEPEKLSTIYSIELITKPILEGKADIVVPKRNEDLFKSTYPDYQYESETEGNKLYNENLKLHGLLSKESEDLDMFFGPRAFLNEEKIISLFMKKYEFVNKSYSYFGPDRYSNTLYFPIVQALKQKLKVLSITIPFSYPPKQKENEEKGVKELFLEKRKKQKLSILIELMHFLLYLEKKPETKLKLIKK